MDDSLSNKEYALSYAQRGLAVFPCHYQRRDGKCSCGKADCGSPAKHPLTSGGCKDATTDTAQVEKWWTTNPFANIGIATGQISNCYVIDCDGDAGLADLAELEDQHSKLDCPKVRTGGGGAHLWFALSGGVAITNGTRLHGTHIDVRGEGGYVIAPPSVHRSGNSYEWTVPLNGHLSPAPQWVINWLGTTKSDKGQEKGSAKLQFAGDLDSPGVGEGQRHAKLVEYVGRHLGYGELGSAVLLKAIQWGATCNPPMDEQEVIEVVTGLERKHGAAQDADDDGGDGDAGDADSQKEKRASQATLLLRLADGIELFHDFEGRNFASFKQDGILQTHPIRSTPFRQWISRRFWQEYKSSAGAQAVIDAINVLEGLATFDGDEEPVFLRVGHCTGDTGQNALVIDLGTVDWSAVVITAAGWQVVPHSPIRFRRTKGLRPLPVPQRGGSVVLLRTFLNVKPEDWPLVAAWLLGCFHPRGPYPILAMHGEAGSGKSTASRVLRQLIDPNEAPLRREPRNEHDLCIAANNSRLVVLDNLSGIKDWLSDGLCRLSTGGGMSTRKLFENDEEQLFNATRPAIINGIDELATRGDLVDRCLQVTLERIPDEQRKPEADFWKEFDEAAPLILGALFDAVATALQKEASVKLDSLPRMADFARWSAAGESALGLAPGEFIEAYRRTSSSGHQSVIEACAVGRALVKFITEKGLWSGTASELLYEVEQYASESDQRRKDWPVDGTRMGNRLRRLAPNLRASGIGVTFGDRHKKKRLLSLWCEDSGKTASPASPASPARKSPSETGDAENGASVTSNTFSVTPAATGDAGDATGDADKITASPPKPLPDKDIQRGDAGDAKKSLSPHGFRF